MSDFPAGVCWHTKTEAAKGLQIRTNLLGKPQCDYPPGQRPENPTTISKSALANLLGRPLHRPLHQHTQSPTSYQKSWPAQDSLRPSTQYQPPSTAEQPHLHPPNPKRLLPHLLLPLPPPPTLAPPPPLPLGPNDPPPHRPPLPPVPPPNLQMPHLHLLLHPPPTHPPPPLRPQRLGRTYLTKSPSRSNPRRVCRRDPALPLYPVSIHL